MSLLTRLKLIPIENGSTPINDVELFAGCGGMSLGLSQAGFVPSVQLEIDSDCVACLRQNSALFQRQRSTVPKVVAGDVRQFDWKSFDGKIRVLSAGVPCQPFSIGGLHNAQRDDRNLFPALLDVVRKTKPRIVFIENVKGLARQSFSQYLSYVVRQLKYPSIKKKNGERWLEHEKRLSVHELGSRTGPEYNVEYRVINAADFGVPQIRMRLFIVATRSDLGTYLFPRATHSRRALECLLRSQDYWDKYGLVQPRIYRSAVEHFVPDHAAPWVTVRQTISDLCCSDIGGLRKIENNEPISGARLYKGHTGSQFDWPAKTIKSGVHGVPGGENMLCLGRGKVRYFTMRELARIQTFPDDFSFSGSRTRITRQIGNAVPPLLAQALAEPLKAILNAAPEISELTRFESRRQASQI